MVRPPQNNQKINYITYARKSQDPDDRQAQSLPDQLTWASRVRSERGLRNYAVYGEAKSALVPGKRPMFDEMIELIKAGKANGIVCYHLNRLTRNELDSGLIGWLLRTKQIQSIVTSEREYRPEDNVLVYGVETAMAAQYSLDLQRIVPARMRLKVERGGWVALAPIGYLNQINPDHTRTVVPDPRRFHLMREAWNLFLTGEFSVPEIQRHLTAKGLTRRQNNVSGQPISRSCLYQAFHNPFYAGVVCWNGQSFPGKHEPMISAEEFERAQVYLPNRSRPRPKHRQLFTYSRLFRCGECGATITAEHKTKTLATTGKAVTYTYYHCTHRKAQISCSQRGSLSEYALTRTIQAFLSTCSVPRALVDWTLREYLKQRAATEVAKEVRVASIERDIAVVRSQIERLIQMRALDRISDEEFVAERSRLSDRSALLETQLKRNSCHLESGGRFQKLFGALPDLERRFRDATPDEQRELIVLTGSNRTIQNKKALISAQPWLIPVKRFRQRRGHILDRLELEERVGISMEDGVFAPHMSEWWTTVNEVRNILANSDVSESSTPTSKAA